jgi:NAD(P)-dependent dehydrogenase (short-subunit alcohol dehydrogenase family)
MPSTELHDLNGQLALVTGATSGLGRAVALRLAADGADVIVHGRDAERGAETVGLIAEAGGRARFIAADLSDSADITRLASDAGDIGVLVNNAGFSLFGPTADIAAERFDALFASNVRAPFLLVAAVGPAMVRRGAGSIVNVSSMAGRIGLDGAAAYGASKAALESMTRAWAVEFSPTVRVNAVAAARCTRRERRRSAPRPSVPPHRSTARPTPRRSPRSLRSLPHRERATSQAP